MQLRETGKDHWVLMSEYFPTEGEFTKGEFPSVLYGIFKNGITGVLIIKTDIFEKKIIIEGKKITFATSNNSNESMGNYLLKENIITEEIYKETRKYMIKNYRRFGRSMLELGFMTHDKLWELVRKHIKNIILSVFDLEFAKYDIKPEYGDSRENITLDEDILTIIIQGIREMKDEEYFINVFKNIKELFISKRDILSEILLLPYEKHILECIERESKVKKIVKESELLQADTLKVLYMFLILDVISTKKVSQDKVPENEGKSHVRKTFSSYEDALKHYNSKFEFIFKILSKEIGPIAQSIISKAVEDINENLPPFLGKIRLNSCGDIDQESVLKSAVYYEFEENISDFIRGLEEILYAEIFVVRKHLGTDYEKQVLNWLKGIEN